MDFRFPLRSSPSSSMATILLYALVHVLIACALLVVLLGEFAHAQSGPLTTSTYDFGPMAVAALDFAAPTILGIASILGLWLMKRVSSWLGLRIDADRRSALDHALSLAVSFALEKVGDRARGGIPIDLKHDAIATAAGYAQRSVPDALHHFGIDSRRLGEMVESRLEGVLYDPEVPEAELHVLSRPAPRAPIS